MFFLHQTLVEVIGIHFCLCRRSHSIHRATHPRQSRGWAVVSLTHVYKPLVGLYSFGRASIEKRPYYLKHHAIVFLIVKPLIIERY